MLYVFRVFLMVKEIVILWKVGPVATENKKKESSVTYMYNCFCIKALIVHKRGYGHKICI